MPTNCKDNSFLDKQIYSVAEKEMARQRENDSSQAETHENALNSSSFHGHVAYSN
jgi:hypothetical protein